MNISQRSLHARLWPAVALLLVALLAAAILARRPQPFARGDLPGAAPAPLPATQRGGASR
ncbi:MAG: hypothetical protein ACT4PL_05960 [Phycisphaerales bacterium]